MANTTHIVQVVSKLEQENADRRATLRPQAEEMLKSEKKTGIVKQIVSNIRKLAA